MDILTEPRSKSSISTSLNTLFYFVPPRFDLDEKLSLKIFVACFVLFFTIFYSSVWMIGSKSVLNEVRSDALKDPTGDLNFFTLTILGCVLSYSEGDVGRVSCKT